MVKFTMLGSPTAWDNMRTKTEVCSATANQAKAEFLVRKDSFASLIYGIISFAFHVQNLSLWLGWAFATFCGARLRGLFTSLRESRVPSLTFRNGNAMIARCFLSAYHRCKDWLIEGCF
jgi:hypothetical protein